MNDPATASASGGDSASGPSPVRIFRPLRTWPALGLVGLMFIARFGPGFLEGGMGVYWMLVVPRSVAVLPAPHPLVAHRQSRHLTSITPHTPTSKAEF